MGQSYTIKFVFVNYYIENLEMNGAYGIKDYSSKHSLPKSVVDFGRQAPQCFGNTILSDFKYFHRGQLWKIGTRTLEVYTGIKRLKLNNGIVGKM
ncbi:hypothetical protein T05_10791 [Trichinella murrelli]|uniref:Uncharacterized protein n=1 Tax=Trichinella murrelli TaxID=144512 RepID=A0A0V0U148_9BILA|nr:hypothetical protein T05_10791 [Trichinella murrelli]